MNKLTALLITLFFVGSVQATIISYNGYTLNSEQNIVTKEATGLQWLQWDVTSPLRWNVSNMLTALEANTLQLTISGNTYDYGSGWSLASNTQMAELFNDFVFGAPTSTWWDSIENTSQSQYKAWDSGDDISTNPALQVLSLFGYTVYQEFSVIDPLVQARILFGENSDGDSRYNQAVIGDDWTTSSGSGSVGAAVLDGETVFVGSIYYENYGFALVRNTQAIPEPGSLGLVLAGLGLLCLLRFQQHT